MPMFVLSHLPKSSIKKRPSGAADSKVSAPKRLRIDQPSSGQSPGVTVSLKRV